MLFLNITDGYAIYPTIVKKSYFSVLVNKHNLHA